LKTVLKNIASIQTGLFAKTETEGDIVYLQVKDFDEIGKITLPLHPDLKLKSAYDKHLLKPGDVLFAAKGNKNFATFFEHTDEACVASTSFFVLRLLVENILPAFLVLYLNHPSIQKLLKANAIGTSMASISKAVLEDLEISIPDIKTQETILRISNLRNKENQLKQQIEILRDKQIQQQIINAIK